MLYLFISASGCLDWIHWSVTCVSVGKHAACSNLRLKVSVPSHRYVLPHLPPDKFIRSSWIWTTAGAPSVAAVKLRAASAQTRTEGEIISCEVSAHWANLKHECLSKYNTQYRYRPLSWQIVSYIKIAAGVACSTGCKEFSESATVFHPQTLGEECHIRQHHGNKKPLLSLAKSSL